MGRPASVRNKAGWWVTEAGGKLHKLGRVDAMSREGAMSALSWILQGNTKASPKDGTVADLVAKYLAWVQVNRSDRLHAESKRHLERFTDHVGADTPATAVDADHLESWTSALLAAGHDPLYARKHATSLRTAYNRARKARWTPKDYRPFDGVDGVRVEPKALLESDLPTADEVRRLFLHANDATMRDFLLIFHATGARTHELCQARVGDFQRQGRTIVLSRHKRSRTMRTPTPRTIVLNPVAYGIVSRRCEGRAADAPIFTTRRGTAYTSGVLDHRFATLRKRAKVRMDISLYSFRHLYISDCLQAGLDVLLVAKLAGTSAKMIECVYGHWRTSAFRGAQDALESLRRSQAG
jgi:integrase